LNTTFFPVADANRASKNAVLPSTVTLVGPQESMKRMVDVPAANVPPLLQLPPSWITPDPPSIAPPARIVR
jgi:hypothetical protein